MIFAFFSARMIAVTLTFKPRTQAMSASAWVWVKPYEEVAAAVATGEVGIAATATACSTFGARELYMGMADSKERRMTTSHS